MVSCEVSAADEEIVVRRGEALAYHRAHADEDASESDAGGARVMGGGTPSLVCHRGERSLLRVRFLQSLPRLAIACKRKMLRRVEIDFLRLNRAKKRLLQHYLHIFIFSLFFFEIFVKILMNLPLFVQNVDFFKQLS